MKDLIHKRTTFGSVKGAKFFYMLGSSLAFAIIYVTARKPIPYELPLPKIVIAGGIALIIFSLFGSIGRLIDKTYREKNQRTRDMKANAIFEQAKNSSIVDFSLYLRAFETTDKMLQEDSSIPLVPGFDPRVGRERLNDFETCLAEAVETSIPLVALGRSGEHFGAGRIKADELKWKEDIKILAKHATILFILPSERPGTQWEIDWVIKNNYLYKTIFILPPNKSFFTILPKGRKNFQWEKKWNSLIPLMHEKGFEFPDYDKAGYIFALKKDGKMLTKELLHRYQNPLFLGKLIDIALKKIARYYSQTEKSN